MLHAMLPRHLGENGPTARKADGEGAHYHQSQEPLSFPAFHAGHSCLSFGVTLLAHICLRSRRFYS